MMEPQDRMTHCMDKCASAKRDAMGEKEIEIRKEKEEQKILRNKRE